MIAGEAELPDNGKCIPAKEWDLKDDRPIQFWIVRSFRLMLSKLVGLKLYSYDKAKHATRLLVCADARKPYLDLKTSVESFADGFLCL